MAIPGMEVRFEVRAKVRVGERREVNGRQIPASTDWFVSTDPELTALFGEKPNEIRIWLPYEEAEENFSTGLEWWRGKQLACYTKGYGEPPMALRLPLPDLRGEHVRKHPVIERRGERVPIICSSHTCPDFGKNADNKRCRPMGRLVFWLDGGSRGSVLEFDTKGWETIKQISSFLHGAAREGDLRAQPYALRVRFQTKGDSRYPVVTISKVDDDGERAQAA